MKPLQLYSIFHLNLAYSSIEEEQRSEVIAKCYWPLLRLARKKKIPIGIEASGYTLEIIASLDPEWINELRGLMEEGMCEFLGSGYAQLIGPLVPAEVNAANLRIGHQVYDRLLGVQPKVALVNEQAYSAGLVQHYIDAGYQTIITEWDNPARHHPEWKTEWRFYPQYACGPQGEMISLIWNKSIAFQKFQRYAHGELTLAEYQKYILGHVSNHERAFPLYGNDVEVFDFRPGRYETEAILSEDSEWERIETLYDTLQRDPLIALVLPSEVLALLVLPEAGHRLQLESPEQPIPVKKQGKYNVTRWAVTGRDDSGINTTCWQCFSALKHADNTGENEWKELCFLWSSDFRTHITDRRWRSYQRRLQLFHSHVKGLESKPQSYSVERVIALGSFQRVIRGCQIEAGGHFLFVETETQRLRLNCRRGLAIDGLWFKHISEQPLIRTIPHGFFDDISMGADYYSGHLIFEAPGQPKITDLCPVKPEVWELEEEKGLCVKGIIPTLLGPIHKTLIIREQGGVSIHYHLEWREKPSGALRLGHMTLNPEAFDHSKIRVNTHNGGYHEESFLLGAQTIDFGRSVSFLVSASGALALTEGVLAIGDNHSRISIHSNQEEGYHVGLVTSYSVGTSFFSRIGYSVGEFDDTTKGAARHSQGLQYGFTITADSLIPLNQSPISMNATLALSS